MPTVSACVQVPECVCSVSMELQESVGAKGDMVAGLNAAGKEIIGQSTQEDGAQIRLQLNTLNTRWARVLELPARQNNVDTINTRTGTIPLPADQQKEMKMINTRWVQVSKDLPEKQKQIESLLKELSHFQDRLTYLSSWTSTTRTTLEENPDNVEPKLIDEVQVKKPEVEGVLAKGQELYKDTPPSQPEKEKYHSLSDDWRAIQGQMIVHRERLAALKIQKTTIETLQETPQPWLSSTRPGQSSLIGYPCWIRWYRHRG
uniref:dystrophin-like n=1 Tax=Oncorhynchus gorbuscha TaxID=8017 RepID=UPI001EAF2D6C|nr:dystrophin-like [Oncorhynchus gorbuscha]